MEQPRPRFSRFRAAPNLMAKAPVWVAVVVGLALIVLGLLITASPLASLWLLAVYVGVSCILSGFTELSRDSTLPRPWPTVLGALWIVIGAAIIGWLGFSIAILPIVLAVVLLIGGISELPRLFRGTVSERVLAGALALMQLAFGVLALTWPDLTTITVAILFGVRTVIFGVLLVWRSIRRSRVPRAEQEAEPTPAKLRRADAGRWVAAALVVVLTGGSWWVSANLRDGLPVIDAFYTAPATVPDIPGALLRAEAWPGAAPDGASVQRILYTTTDANDDPAIASAIVVVPDDLPDGPRPVIIWDHGTTGIAQTCAPSLMPDMFTAQAIPAVASAIENGWVVVATDYSGQGAAGTFPYLIGEGEARSALDSMRAAQAIDGVTLSDQAVVWGHSQGGHAALWTGAIANRYAPEIDVLGVAAISPAASPEGMAKLVTDGPANPMTALATAWVLIPYSETYADVDYRQHVNPAARALVREMSARCTSQPGLLVSVLAGLSVADDQHLFLGDLTGGVLGERLRENKTLGPWSMPLIMAWGGSDEIIAPSLQEEYVAELCSAGIDFTWHEYPGYTHMGIVADDSKFLPVLVDWTESMLAGREVPPAKC